MSEVKVTMDECGNNLVNMVECILMKLGIYVAHDEKMNLICYGDQRSRLLKKAMWKNLDNTREINHCVYFDQNCHRCCP